MPTCLFNFLRVLRQTVSLGGLVSKGFLTVSARSTVSCQSPTPDLVSCLLRLTECQYLMRETYEITLV